jgi:membrane protease subunit (stomatin/prohibitin family)
MSLMNIIRCDLPQGDYLVHKWQPATGNSNRQNQIRLGSSLRVRPGEAAVFFYTAKPGEKPIDVIQGPSDLILQTKNLPILASIVGLAYGGDSPFQAEVYFINLGHATQFKWGVEWFDAFDPRFPDFPVPVSATGTVTFSISDIEAFVKVQRLDSLAPTDLSRQIRPRIVNAIRANLVNLASARNIPLVQIGARISEVGETLTPKMAEVLGSFGVRLNDFVIETIEFDKTTPGFNDLMRVTRDLQRNLIEAQGEVAVANVKDSQAMQSFHTADSMAIQREAARLQMQTAFLPTHQINLQADVAKTAAESLGKVGSAGGGGGGGGMGSELGVAAIAIGMGGALSNVFASQIASTVPARIGAAPTPPTAPPPPAPPVDEYVHISRAGVVIGVFSRHEIPARVARGEFSFSDMAWKTGLPVWAPLYQVLGGGGPPPPPPPPAA